MNNTNTVRVTLTLRRVHWRRGTVLNIICFCVSVCARASMGAYVRACVCVGSRARLRVHMRARVFPYLSNMQNACAVLHFRVSSLAPPHFSTKSHKRHDFQTKVIKYKTCVLFSLRFYLKHFSFQKYSARYCHEFDNVFISSTSYSCYVLMKLEISRQIL